MSDKKTKGFKLTRITKKIDEFIVEADDITQVMYNFIDDYDNYSYERLLKTEKTVEYDVEEA